MSMPPDIRVVHNRGFLRAIVQGVTGIAAGKEALAEIAGSAPPGVDLLVDVRGPTAHLTLPELTELAAEFSSLRIGAGRKTAVLTEENRFDKAQFFAISARGRGNVVQAFTSFEDAIDWLANES